MSPQFQTIAALLIVAAAAIWLVARSFAKGRKPGCGDGCGCAPDPLKAKIRRREDFGGHPG
jgi:hypothetical protein